MNKKRLIRNTPQHIGLLGVPLPGKILIVLLIILIIATPAYAVNVVDTMLCKKVFLRAIERTVLVNRLTGEVKYILRKGQWILLEGERKQECQSMYNAQIYLEQHTDK